MDALDRRIINELQGGFPVCEYPFREMAQRLGSTESELITRLGCMLEDGLLTRFGPMFHAEHLGGGLSLCAMRVPPERFEAVQRLSRGRAQLPARPCDEHVVRACDRDVAGTGSRD